MNDDLVKRLLAVTDDATVNPDGPEAAARIAELEARVAETRRAALGEAISLLEQIAVKEIKGEYESKLPRCIVTLSDCIEKIRALMEKKDDTAA